MKKFYTVLKGYEPGIYDSWADCERQVKGFSGADYRSFKTSEQAEAAFYDQPRIKLDSFSDGPIYDSYCVDAACSGNPGPVEYRCVHTGNRNQVFIKGPFDCGTNNIGEFLALAHAIADFHHKGIQLPIYSDSQTAIAWINQKRCNSKLRGNLLGTVLGNMLDMAERWLNGNNYTIHVLKWQTHLWGEIPADFGRK